MKAICSFSGGLDSILAVRIMREQGIEIEAVYFHNGFGGCGERQETERSLRNKADRLGVGITFMDVGKDLIRIIRDPEFGFGKNMNPCMDCHLLFFRKCAEYMAETGASFIVTGEVVGERPMSQRKHAMEVIDKNSGAEGFILRPLSARIMKPTVPEIRGWVDREKLYAISGRSRKPQMRLAEEFGIDFYPNAAGGCLLTEKEFSRKLLDLMKHKRDIDLTDIELLRTGRHFRLSSASKIVLGRDEKENRMLLERFPGHLYFMTVDVPGPVGIVRGDAGKAPEELAMRIISAYSNIRPGQEMEIRVGNVPGEISFQKTIKSVPRKEVLKFLV